MKKATTPPAQLVWKKRIAPRFCLFIAAWVVFSVLFLSIFIKKNSSTFVRQGVIVCIQTIPGIFAKNTVLHYSRNSFFSCSVSHIRKLALRSKLQFCCSEIAHHYFKFKSPFAYLLSSRYFLLTLRLLYIENKVL